jgi:L-threonylcarbamoyladenylate synthase
MPFMPTPILSLDPDQPDPQALQQAVAILRVGGTVAFPTETVYGLGANALDTEAVAKIFRAKGRPSTDPLIVHLADFEQLSLVATSWPPLLERLAVLFIPGPLTIILPKAERLPLNVSAGLDSVAVRWPSHPVARALLKMVDLPIAAPSANLFSRPSPTLAEHVRQDLDGRIDLILDGGQASIGLESTILDVRPDPPLILREGAIPLEALQGILPAVQVKRRYLDAAQALSAPGNFIKHYAPRTPLRLYEGSFEAVLASLHAEARRGERLGWLLYEEYAAACMDCLGERYLLGALSDLTTVAYRLFEGLRALDEAGLNAIIAVLPPPEGLGAAVRDRLLRAAEGVVISVV